MDDMREQEVRAESTTIDLARGLQSVDRVVDQNKKSRPLSRVSLIAPTAALMLFGAACLDIGSSTPLATIAPRATETAVSRPPTIPTLTARQKDALERVPTAQRPALEKEFREGNQAVVTEQKQEAKNEQDFQQAAREALARRAAEQKQINDDIQKNQPHSPVEVGWEVTKSVGTPVVVVVGALALLALAIGVGARFIRLLGRLVGWAGGGRGGAGGGGGGGRRFRP